MKKLILATTALTALATTASAGGVERTPQSVGVLFEEGRYFEFSGSFGSPDVSGVLGVSSGDIADSFFNLGAAYKADLNETISYAIIYDQPYGAGVTYPAGTGYLFAGSNAELKSHALTGILQYNLGNGGSVYGGLRAQTLQAEAVVTPFGYSVDGERDLAFGYLVGAAYEKPEIALRVALTYNSEIDHDLDTTENGAPSTPTAITTPQSVNLEFQSGIAEDTLVFGSVRWVEWTVFNISPANFPANPLVFYADDRTTYTLGLGRRLNETWSVLGSVSYEENTGSATGNLGPTDGFTSVSLGAIYTKDNMKITGGVRYVDIGDATTTVAADFSGNSAIAAGLKVGWSF